MRVAAYKEHNDIVELLLDYKANPCNKVCLTPPRYSFSFELMDLEHRKSTSKKYSIVFIVCPFTM